MSDVLVGPPSDDVPDMLATGSTDIATIYVSMSARHPDGRDADYLEWHGLDHQPEQHRLRSLRASLRLVSTPACRRARAASDERYDNTDHVMTYFFTGVDALEEFNNLNAAMTAVGRTPYLLPLVERGVYRLAGTVAAPRIKVGADVLPWWPARGVYLLVERGEASASDLAEVPGVGGAWWGAGLNLAMPYSTADNDGLQITYCFLDDDPVDAAVRLRPVLDQRWSDAAVVPLLAASFHPIVRYEWGRYLP